MIAHADIQRLVYQTGSPFRRLEALLADVRPNPALPPITMTVGEPRHAPPQGIAPTLAATMDDFGRYPLIQGILDYRRAVCEWLTRRYELPVGTVTPEHHVVQASGSRDGLAFGPRCARDLRPDIERPVVLMQNPFYQAYIAGALMAGCEIWLLEEDDLRGDRVPADILARTVCAYIASPTNPQGVVLRHSDWHAWIERARLHGFMLFADECYSEIYRATPPAGVLEVAARTAGGLRQVVTFNSLSKRSNLPGMRTGFAAGDEAFMAAFTRLRNMGGPQVPMPLQAVGALAWRDETHVTASRALYARKWALVEDVLGPHLGEPTPQAGFFLWLKLPAGLNDVEATIRLWQEQALRTIPGSYIAYPATPGLASDRLRLALVDDEPTTRQALTRLATLFA